MKGLHIDMNGLYRFVDTPDCDPTSEELDYMEMYEMAERTRPLVCDTS